MRWKTGLVLVGFMCFNGHALAAVDYEYVAYEETKEEWSVSSKTVFAYANADLTVTGHTILNQFDESNVRGILVSDNQTTPKITLNTADITVKSEKEIATGVEVNTKGFFESKGKIIIDIFTGGENQPSYGIVTYGKDASAEINGADITVSSPDEQNGRGALAAHDGGSIEAKKAVYNINGNLISSPKDPSSSYENGKLSIHFDKGSVFNGFTSYNNAYDNGSLKVVMDGTTWNMAYDPSGRGSILSDLKFEGDKSEVNFLGDGVWNKLTTNTLSGDSGLFNMRTDIVGGEGDKLKVTSNNVDGNHLVTVTNNGSSNATGDETLTIIETGKDTAIDHFKLTNIVEVGGYEYDLRAVADKTNHLELAATGKTTDPGGGGVNLFGSNYMMAYAENQTLMKRLGDLRRGDEPEIEGDIWARAYGGKLSSGGDRMIRGYDMTYSGFQLGLDRSVDRKDGKGTSYAGAFLGYANGSPDFSGGDGDIDGFSIGGYYTFMHETGFYTDLVMKYGWYDNEYNIRDSAGQKVKAESDTQVFSLSLEVGKRFHFDKEVQEGYYVEPQAQFTYSHFAGDSFRASNGLSTKVDSFASKLARVGLHLGYETKNTKNPMNLYIKGYFMKEFDGNIDYRFNGGRKHTSSYEDNWFVYGFGATMQLGSKKNQNLYLDFERSSGGRMKQDWAINAGYRYNF